MHKELAEQFEELGIEPSNEVLDKCYEICLTYNITDAVDLVDQWMAYSISHLNGVDPTVQHLLDMETKEFKTKNEKAKKNTQLSTTTGIHDYDTNSLAMYGITSCPQINHIGSPSTYRSDGNEDDAIMDTYNCNTPKANKSTISRTPASKSEVLFNPISYSPIIGTPRAHTEGSGKIVYTFGSSHLLSNALWSIQEKQEIQIKNLLTHENESMNNKTKYLFDNLIDKTIIYGDQIFNRGKEICQKYFGEDTLDYDLHHPDLPNQEIIKTIGIIACEHDGILDANSTILIGTDEMRLRTVRLDLNRCESFGVFPGQLVLISGVNPRSDILYVDEICSERLLKAPVIPNLSKQINFVICSGPYTNYDDLAYDPLQDLLTYCLENKPDVLIMTGPFMEADHSMIEGSVLGESFEIFFEKLLSGIIDKLGMDIKICLVSSSKDANSDCVYPTPPISTKKSFPNVQMLPDPCIIDLNGIKIGVTSTDILNDLVSNELFMNSGDKIKRVINYLFHQGSFYPMNPPADGLCVDSDLLNKFAKIDQIPNILIVPSNQKCFIRDCNGCLAINPGRLTDNKGGTFARLIVHPSKEDNIKRNWYNYGACQVMKV